MVPNQRNIELVAVGNTTTALKLVLDSDGKTAWAIKNKKAPVRIVRGVPGDANYWSSDVIKWSNELNVGPVGAYAADVEDKWTIADVNSIVDPDNVERELNLRVWPVGLSSIDWQRMINTGHFKWIRHTLPAIQVATEFAGMLDSSYKNQREHGSGGLHAYAVASIVGTGAVATVVKNSNTFTVAATGVVVGDYVVIAAGKPAYRVIEVYIGGLSGKLSSSAVEDGTGKIGLKALQEATGAKAGLTVEATPNKFVPGQYNWEKTRLQVTASGMGGATYDTQAFEGVGTWQQIAEREWFAKGNEGKPMRTNNMAPYNPPNYEVAWVQPATALTYGVFNLRFSHDMLETLGQPNNSPKSIFVAELTGATVLHAALELYISQTLPPSTSS